MRNIRQLLILTVVFLGLGLFLIPSDSVDAAVNIRDGSAFIPKGGSFLPEQNNVDPAVKKKWEQGKVEMGGKYPSQLFHQKYGNFLMYEIYTGETYKKDEKAGRKPNASKRGITQTPSGNYLTFDGWAVNKGYHHHYAKNKATYIGLINKRDSKDRLIFKTAMRRGGEMTKELEYTGDPTCSDSTYKTDECNMRYKNIQFRAYLDLNDIFGGKNANKEWNMYIIKKVGNKLVYEDLVLPFDTEKFGWKKGEVSMSSGKDNRILSMTKDTVVKRSKADASDTSSWAYPKGNPRRYFAYGGKYKVTKIQEHRSNSDGKVSNWYQVKDNVSKGGVKASGRNLWGTSAYWDFDGDIATLRYQKLTKVCPNGVEIPIKDTCSVDVTIKHIDAISGKQLAKEETTKKVGSKYTYTPKKDGHFKDSDGNPYIASPKGQKYSGKTPQRNLSFTFKYKADLPEPNITKPGEGITKARPDGDVYWEIQRDNENKDSKISASSDLKVGGTHYATRNIKSTMKLPGKATKTGKGILTDTASMGATKDKNLDYSFAYDYTDYYKEIYKCTDKQDNHCFVWKFDKNVPNWDKEKHFSVTDKINIGHSYKETISANKIEDILSQRWQTGKKHVYTISATPSKSTHYEKFKKTGNQMQSVNTLKAQTSLVVKPDDMLYQVSLPSRRDVGASLNPMKKGNIYGNYYPVELDESLREEYANNTSHSNNPGELFLQQETMKDNGYVGGAREYEITFASDYFFLGKKTGCQVGYPYAEKLHGHLVNGTSKPTEAEVVSTYI